MTGEKIIIAIDGHSSCGKSTMAKSLAKILGYIYIDSGAMYRAVTLNALRNGWVNNGKPEIDKIVSGLKNIKITFIWDKSTEKNTTYLNGENVEEEIRKPEVSQNVSPISTIAEVRREMVKQQRENGLKKGIVMDGRDIGTVVFPKAELKIFMTALPEIRAQRRFLELSENGLDVSFAEILKNVKERDEIDSTRAISPLKKAEDALVLDNSNLSREEQFKWTLKKIEEIINKNES
ncbi:MAG: (d)CMP kinase [Prolixibacteraceae bacterium]|jgi:CMP/dCMP kinase|nr:(d)CMP kinase [Prolixibacteraceae bacterium]MBT6764196.1 (d)CMP kinase [Prolixibacteraceae bacterium]MBT6999135.1 (d)CMP kinase [Prolixibacteraceae bacterium]MBT7396089.1 (d)CMP kinase [Prolixibacteraceae bacterium]